MKKIILCTIALVFSTCIYAQQGLNINGGSRPSISNKGNHQISINGKLVKPNKTFQPLQKRGGGGTPLLQSITTDSIGSTWSGLYNSTSFDRTSLFAHPAINTIMYSYQNNADIFIGSYYAIRFGLSTDGGATWTKNKGPIYAPAFSYGGPFSSAIAPQSGIYNPPGNTVPNNAYLHFFAPTFRNLGQCTTVSNYYEDSLYGAFTHGAAKVSGGTTQKSEETSTSFSIPDDAVLNTGDNSYWVVSRSHDISGSANCDYRDSIIIGKGVWASTKYNYTYQKIYAPMEMDNSGVKFVQQSRIAFSPNGQVGYISVLGHESYTDKPDSVYYPIIFKSTDAGASWSRIASIDIQNLDNELTDGGGSRALSIAFDHDLSVDANNNLHIMALVHYISVAGGSNTFGSLLDGTLSLNGTNAFSYFDIYTTDGGSSWNAQELGDPNYHPQNAVSIYWGDVAQTQIASFEYGRPSISRSLDGTRLLFTWAETDTLINNSGNNDTPDSKIVGYNVTSGLWTNTIDATKNTDADASMNMVSVSPLALNGSSAGCYKLPLTYTVIIGLIQDSVYHFYVDGAEVCDADYTVSGSPVALNNLVSVKEIKGNSSFEIGQNYPNPFHNETRFDINLKYTTDVSVEIINVLGKQVKSFNFNNLSSGMNTLTIDGSDLASGMYTYTVKIGTEKISRTMMIK